MANTSERICFGSEEGFFVFRVTEEGEECLVKRETEGGVGIATQYGHSQVFALVGGSYARSFGNTCIAALWDDEAGHKLAEIRFLTEILHLKALPRLARFYIVSRGMFSIFSFPTRFPSLFSSSSSSSSASSSSSSSASSSSPIPSHRGELFPGLPPRSQLGGGGGMEVAIGEGRRRGEEELREGEKGEGLIQFQRNIAAETVAISQDGSHLAVYAHGKLAIGRDTTGSYEEGERGLRVILPTAEGGGQLANKYMERAPEMMVWSGDSSRLALALADGTTVLVLSNPLAAGPLAWTKYVRSHTPRSVASLAFSPDARLLAITTVDSATLHVVPLDNRLYQGTTHKPVYPGAAASFLKSSAGYHLLLRSVRHHQLCLQRFQVSPSMLLYGVNITPIAQSEINLRTL